MRVAVVHYHLKPGGVTRIVESAAAALAPHGVELVAIAGEPYTGDAELKTATVPGLAYTQDTARPDPAKLLSEISAAATQALVGAPDLWHIHNHSLGKNTAMPDVVWQLAQEAPVLLQIHDFAEDGRPANYTAIGEGLGDWQRLYPYGSRVHYAVLNRRDESFLRGAGLPEDCLHLLPNPVSVPAMPTEPPQRVLDADRLLLYPTRAIRRKNVGEFLFWATLAEEGELFAATLAPNNPTARPVYDRWVGFAKQHGLRAQFELANAVDLSFPQVMAAADAIISTSVAEGFGMAFLEPFLFGKGLVGRDLPEITGDFLQDGVSLYGLYDRLGIPLEWIGGADALRERITPALTQAYAAYGRECGQAEIDTAMAAAVHGGRVDFGRLDESMQEKAIEHMLALPHPQDDIAPMALASQGDTTIAANRDAITAHYNLEQYGQRLFGIYQQLLNAKASALESVDPARVLGAFLDPARFCLLRS